MTNLLSYYSETRISLIVCLPRDIVLVAREGFVFGPQFWVDVKKLNREHGRAESLSNKYGVAGYDNQLESMQSVVILHGPAVAGLQGPDHLQPALQAVDIFPLLCHLLNLPTIPPSNGSIHAVRNLLKHPPSQSLETIKNVIKFYTEKEKLPKTGDLFS